MPTEAGQACWNTKACSARWALWPTPAYRWWPKVCVQYCPVCVWQLQHLKHYDTMSDHESYVYVAQFGPRCWPRIHSGTRALVASRPLWDPLHAPLLQAFVFARFSRFFSFIEMVRTPRHKDLQGTTLWRLLRLQDPAEHLNKLTLLSCILLVDFKIVGDGWKSQMLSADFFRDFTLGFSVSRIQHWKEMWQSCFEWALNPKSSKSCLAVPRFRRCLELLLNTDNSPKLWTVDAMQPCKKLPNACWRPVGTKGLTDANRDELRWFGMVRAWAQYLWRSGWVSAHVNYL